MKKNIIPQTVSGNGVVYIIILIGIPVVGQLFGAENQDILVPILVILNNRQSGEGLTETHTVSQDAAVEFFQFIDNRQGSILLVVKEQIPNLTLFEACCLIGQHIFRDVFQELVENVVKGKEVDEVGAVFVVGSGNGVYDFLCHFLHTGSIVPELVKQLQIAHRKGSRHLLNHGIGIVATLTAQVNGGKALDGGVCHIINTHEAHHVLIGDIGLEYRFLANPVRTLLGYGFLRQLIAQFDLKFSSIKAALTIQAGNVKFPLFFRRLFCGKGRGGEDKAQLLYALQFLFQLLKSINREGCSCNRNLAVLLNFNLKVIPQCLVDIINQFHHVLSLPLISQ